MSCNELTAISRRSVLKGSAALALWSLVPRSAVAETRDRRLLVVILRGGLDGLSMIAPVGDPRYAGLRGALALSASGANAGRPLDGFFALNPAMPFLHQLYERREALLVHAVATPYRGRSHFDGQDVLESGLPGVGHPDVGWLNRAVAKLPDAGRASARGLAVSPVVPLVMRGPAPVLSWSRRTYQLAGSRDTILRLAALYGETDPALSRAFAEGLDIDGLVNGGSGPADSGRTRPFRDFIETAEAAARLMSAVDGPRIGTLSYDGWDTHANEGAIGGTLFNRLGGLDAALKAYADGMGTAWADTCVVVVTEFGRTVRTNGTAGTDHGTATAAIVVGGAVNGGRIIADWPGLSEAALFEGRDLRPTLDLRSVLKGVLADHVGVPPSALAHEVFPEGTRVAPLIGLIRT